MVVEVGGENNRKQTPGRLPRMKKFSLLNYPIISPIQKGVPSVNRRKPVSPLGWSRASQFDGIVLNEVQCRKVKIQPIQKLCSRKCDAAERKPRHPDQSIQMCTSSPAKNSWRHVDQLSRWNWSLIHPHQKNTDINKLIH